MRNCPCCQLYYSDSALNINRFDIITRFMVIIVRAGKEVQYRNRLIIKRGMVLWSGTRFFIYNVQFVRIQTIEIRLKLCSRACSEYCQAAFLVF